MKKTPRGASARAEARRARRDARRERIEREVSRARIYSDEEMIELAVEITARIAQKENLNTVCADVGMTSSMFIRWAATDPRILKLYERAMESRAMLMAHEILEICDDSSGDSTVGEDGRPRVDHEHIQRSRLRVDTRKYIMSKLLPRFADRQRTDSFDFDPDEFNESELKEIVAGADPLAIKARRKA